jgi:hypothetical protein
MKVDLRSVMCTFTVIGDWFQLYLEDAERMFLANLPDFAVYSSHQGGDGVSNGSIINYPEVRGVLNLLHLVMQITILLE